MTDPYAAGLAAARLHDDAPAVSIIVISYNTRAMTLACLRSVLAETRASFELIVIDNASADGSAEALEAEFGADPEGRPRDPRVRLRLERENHGFALANNIAAEEARGEFLLLLNPDTVVLDGAVDRLLDFARRRPEAGIWGGRTVFEDGRLNPASCWKRMTLWSACCRATGLSGLFPETELFNPEAYGGWKRDEEREVDIVTGCFLLIPQTLWKQLGGFDATYVMYGEEADLCLRARALGARPRITPEAVIVHYGGASETVRADRTARILKAKATLIRRHFPRWQRPLGVALHGVWPLTRWLAVLLRDALRGRRSEAASHWREVWRRRGEWLPGYPPPVGPELN